MALFNRTKGLVSRGLEAAGGLVSQATSPVGQAINVVRPGTTDEMVEAGESMLQRGMTQVDQTMPNVAQYTPGGMMTDMVMGNPNPAAQALKDQMSNLMQLSGRADSKIAMKSAKMFGTNEYRNQK